MQWHQASSVVESSVHGFWWCPIVDGRGELARNCQEHELEGPLINAQLIGRYGCRNDLFRGGGLSKSGEEADVPQQTATMSLHECWTKCSRHATAGRWRQILASGWTAIFQRVIIPSARPPLAAIMTRTAASLGLVSPATLIVMPNCTGNLDQLQSWYGLVRFATTGMTQSLQHNTASQCKHQIGAGDGLLLCAFLLQRTTPSLLILLLANRRCGVSRHNMHRAIMGNACSGKPQRSCRHEMHQPRLATCNGSGQH